MKLLTWANAILIWLRKRGFLQPCFFIVEDFPAIVPVVEDFRTAIPALYFSSILVSLGGFLKLIPELDNGPFAALSLLVFSSPPPLGCYQCTHVHMYPTARIMWRDPNVRGHQDSFHAIASGCTHALLCIRQPAQGKNLRRISKTSAPASKTKAGNLKCPMLGRNSVEKDSGNSSSFFSCCSLIAYV